MNHQITEVLDSARADAFAERLIGTLNEGALCLMLSIGHRTGLFDAMAGMPAATSGELAAAAGLHERYVREWLSALVTGRIVDYDPATRRYRLPPEHASYLSRAASPDNIAVFAQYIPVMAQVEEDILHCFRHGGGVSYERYGRFHDVMAEDSTQTVVSALFEHILPLVPGLEARLAAGIDVLDLGCGRGQALLALAGAFPHSRFLGYELSAEAVAHARSQAASLGLDNLRFEQRDLSDFDATAEPAAHDLITTFDAVHDQARPLGLLRGIRRALRPDGIYLMQDIRAASSVENNLDHPLGPLLYSISTMHCMTVSLAQGGEGLGTMWGRELARELLREAGFRRIDIRELAHDFQNDYYLVQP
jgi:SAM-dependent methyltransferase